MTECNYQLSHWYNDESELTSVIDSLKHRNGIWEIKKDSYSRVAVFVPTPKTDKVSGRFIKVDKQ